MDEKTKLYVFAKKEVFLILVFVIVVSITSFIFGFKLGKNYSYTQAKYTQEDREKIEFLSGQEEMVEKVVQEQQEQQKPEVIDGTYQKLKTEFEKLDETAGSAEKEEQPPQEVKAQMPPVPKEAVKSVEVGAPEATPAVDSKTLESLRTKDELSGKFTVQLGFFRSMKNAEGFADGFRVRGYNPIISEVNNKASGIWYRVSLGIFETVAECKDYITKEKSLFRGTDYTIEKFE